MSRNRKTEVRSKFRKWLAIPKNRRKEATGIKTQKEFSKRFNISQHSLSKWKQEPGFFNGVEHERRLHLDEALTGIYQTMVRKAKEGDPQMTKMVLEQAGRYKEDINPKDIGPSEEDVANASNVELAGMIAEMLSDAPGVSETKLQAAIIKSLGDEVPDGLKSEIVEGGEESKEEQEEEKEEEEEKDTDSESEEQEEKTEDDSDEEGENEKSSDGEWWEEDEDIRDWTEEEEKDEDAFELEDHLINGLGQEDEEQDYEEQDEENLETTEEFEVGEWDW